jgi:hypothetical protein
MTTLTSLVNKETFTPLLKPGQYVRIEPYNQYGYYQLPRNSTPEFLPPIWVNMATPFSTSLSAAVDTGQTSPISLKITALDVQDLTLAQYRLVAVDESVRFEVYQPNTVARFANRAGPISFDKASTGWFLANQMYSALPELFLFSDKTPPTIKAYNMDLDATTYYARFVAFGFKYPLEYKEMPIDAATKAPTEPIALTVKVGERT